MQTQTAIPYLTFDIAGRTVMVDPDIYYQIFNVRPVPVGKARRLHKKYIGGIISLRISSENYPILQIKKGRKKRIVQLSRFIMHPPKKMVVDHINGDRLDNRRQNLRIATRRQNALNVKSRTDTGFIGVTIYRIRGKILCRGRFHTESGKTLEFCANDCHENRILAAYAHDKFVLQSGDEDFAHLNFENFKYEPFRSFLLNEDLNKYKIKRI